MKRRDEKIQKEKRKEEIRGKKRRKEDLGAMTEDEERREVDLWRAERRTRLGKRSVEG